MSMSIDYFLKDDLKLQPADAQVFKSMSHLPWNIKPIYGLISDTVPILGYQRGPYIVIAGALGMIAYLSLWYATHLHSPIYSYAFIKRHSTRRPPLHPSSRPPSGSPCVSPI